MGWEVYETESAEQAASVFRKAHLREGICGKSIILHSDNGSPMKGANMALYIAKIRCHAFFSRSSVSDDNPFSEALFKI